ncbi:MAG TPA: helix-turn-helix domain-containing protein [Clostridia bacterium]|nr:helix-turn-helix domain-containing protein [Clostridia bacterium]
MKQRAGALGHLGTKRDRAQLDQALKDARSVRFYQRVLALRLLARGGSIAAASRLVGRSRQTIYNWLERYAQRHRVEDLLEAERGGRPRQAQGLSPARILRELDRCPLDLGYAATTWTVALLARHLRQRYGGALTERTLRRRLKELDLVWKRPRYVYADKDPHGGRKRGRFFANCAVCPQEPSASPKTKRLSGCSPRCARLGANGAKPSRCPSADATPAGSCRARST